MSYANVSAAVSSLLIDNFFTLKSNLLRVFRFLKFLLLRQIHFLLRLYFVHWKSIGFLLSAK